MDDTQIFEAPCGTVSVSCLATKHIQVGGKHVKVWSTKVTVSGGTYPLEEWELTILLKDIVEVHHRAYYAYGIKFTDRAVVGIRANIKGAEWDYGIYTTKSEELFEMIQQARSKFDACSEAQPPSYDDLQRVAYPNALQDP